MLNKFIPRHDFLCFEKQGRTTSRERDQTEMRAANGPAISIYSIEKHWLIDSFIRKLPDGPRDGTSLGRR